MIHGASMVLKELPVILSHEGREPFPHVPRSAKQAASPTPACPLLRRWYPGKAGASDRPGSFFLRESRHLKLSRHLNRQGAKTPGNHLPIIVTLRAIAGSTRDAAHSRSMTAAFVVPGDLCALAVSLFVLRVSARVISRTDLVQQ